MKKALTLLLLLFFTTGCSVTKYDNNYELSIDQILNSNHHLHNVTGTGYRYYLPRGVRLDNSTDYNKVLYAEGNLYYLYVDVISYYYKVNKPYEVVNEAYYSRNLNYNNHNGYIEINKIGQKYLVEMMYNYAKIEAYIAKEDLNKAITDFCYILSSIEFNNDIIETLVGSNTLDFNEEQFNIFEPIRKEHYFLDYKNEYDDNNNYDEIPNNDIIDIEETSDFE